MIITLIDDLLDVWGTISQRDQMAGTKFQLRLREILAWRSAEISFADFLSRALYPDRSIPHYVVAVKHPASTLFRLLFHNNEFIRVYAAFPITSTRSSRQRRREIDQVRDTLHEQFIVFDPVTIDEDVPDIFNKAVAVQGAAPVEVADRESRWPVDLQGTLMEGQRRPFPVSIEPGQLLEIREDIKQQVRIRDYTLIDQAQCVAGYRPNFEGSQSLGMIEEFVYAMNTAEPPRRVVIYSPATDPVPSHPFLLNLYANRYADIRQWVAALKGVTPRA